MYLKCIFSLCLILHVKMIDSRKSDYKKIIFSDFVKDELENLFNKHLKDYDQEVLDLYSEYLKEYNNTNLSRLQPEKVSGEARVITIEGNRKKQLTLTTVSKRRPLIFQIDDFLFEDETDHIINLAIADGLYESLTAGDAIENKLGQDTQFDEFGSIEFEEYDINNDSYINITELRKAIYYNYGTRMSDLLVRDVMKKTYADFNLDGLIEKWEWSIRNITTFVTMINNSLAVRSSKTRMSQTQWLMQTGSKDKTLLSIQDRLHKVTGLPMRLIENSEPLQVVHYQPGGHYDCHLDTDARYYPTNFKPCCHISTESDPSDDSCGPCRFMTVLFFLNETEHGGETAFPVVGVDPYKNKLVDDTGGNVNEDWCDLAQQCSKSKVVVTPKRGRAILWYNHFLDPDTNWTGAIDPNSLHGGCAVHKGSKWVANNWFNAGHHKMHDFLSWARNKYHPQDFDLVQDNKKNGIKSAADTKRKVQDDGVRIVNLDDEVDDFETVDDKEDMDESIYA